MEINVRPFARFPVSLFYPQPSPGINTSGGGGSGKTEWKYVKQDDGTYRWVPIKTGGGGSGGGGFWLPFLKDTGKAVATTVGSTAALDKLFPLKKPNPGDRSSAQDFPLAMQTLIDILGRQGQTDPQAFNRQLVGIGRGTEAEQLATQGSLAQAGPGMLQSGVAQALLAAQGQAGQDRLAGARAQETALAEERMRSDLGLLLDLFINPSLTEQATRAGVSQSIAAANAAKQSGQAQAAAAVLAAILGKGK